MNRIDKSKNENKLTNLVIYHVNDKVTLYYDGKDHHVEKGVQTPDDIRRGFFGLQVEASSYDNAKTFTIEVFMCTGGYPHPITVIHEASLKDLTLNTILNKLGYGGKVLHTKGFFEDPKNDSDYAYRMVDFYLDGARVSKDYKMAIHINRKEFLLAYHARCLLLGKPSKFEYYFRQPYEVEEL